MKKWIALLSITASLMAPLAQAELVETDWKADGDSLATLDTETGIEWLDLTETLGMSLTYVESETGVGGIFEGWRLPTSAEIDVFYDLIVDPTVVTKSGKTTSNELIDDVELFVSLLGNTSNDSTVRSYGLYYRDSGAVRSAGVARTNEAYINYSHDVFTADLEHALYGVWLVSDGGETLSSLNNPEINAANSNAPINQVPLSMGCALFVAGLFLRRRA
jgi:hypothetical protein